MHWLRNWLETHLLDADTLLDEFLYQANSTASPSLTSILLVKSYLKLSVFSVIVISPP